jgi:cobalt-zinc-cadmium efflux system protein
MHDHSQHSHKHGTSGNRIGWAFALNAGFCVIEFIGGVLTNSTAIMADAVHDLGDTLSIGSAWLLERLSKKNPDQVFTYGYRRLSLFGALINSIILVVGSSWVLFVSVPRLFNPQMPMAEGMLGLAVLGITVNGFAAYKLSGGQTMNEKVLNWHLLEDMLGWTAVLLVSIALLFMDWPILDPLLAVIFTSFILFSVYKHFKETLKIFFQAAPASLLVHKINQELNKLEQIESIHHEHCWSLDGEHHVYTAHLLLRLILSASEQQNLKIVIAEKLRPFNLTHTTIELEFPDEHCRDKLN